VAKKQIQGLAIMSGAHPSKDLFGSRRPQLEFLLSEVPGTSKK
jgi:hypothetical protein